MSMSLKRSLLCATFLLLMCGSYWTMKVSSGFLMYLYLLVYLVY